MPCDHTGPADVIDMAERFLRERGVAPERWPGARFSWRENVTDTTYWTSVTIDVERRGGEWIVTRLDRSKDRIPTEELGLRELSPH
jgi:hypothetical protein